MRFEWFEQRSVSVEAALFLLTNSPCFFFRIEVSDANLVTIAGGKWTTYRSIAEEAVDAAISVARLRPQWRHSQTIGLKLEGAHGILPLSPLATIDTCVESVYNLW